MIRIEITSPEVRTREVRGKDGRPLQFREQSGYAHLPGRQYPSEITIALDRDAQPHKAGMYTLDPDSIYVNRYRSLELGRLKLVAEGARK